MVQHVFDDIRPYNDDEVADVKRRLINDKEFRHGLSKLHFPKLFAFSPWLAMHVTSLGIARKAPSINTIEQFQSIISKYVKGIIDSTTTDLKVTGIEHLNINGNYLFLCNHRDIAVDPMLVNYTWHVAGGATTRIAIGDNLLTKPYVSDLMRLNKSFIVKRSIANPREKLKALQTLSAYIRHSIDDGHCVWLAHREGRAKDNLDLTAEAILKMLHISGRKQFDNLGDSLEALNIVPVSLSYELDPCDQLKATELRTKAEVGEYEKDEHEDIESIRRGIFGYKGHVHVHFGQPLDLHHESASDTLALEMDQSIYKGYDIFPINHAAAKLWSEKNPNNSIQIDLEKASEGDELLESRIQHGPKENRDWIIRMYAQPLLSQQGITHHD